MALALALGGCGFQLRGPAQLPFTTLHVEGVARFLRRLWTSAQDFRAAAAAAGPIPALD
ncbi:MAG: hypothetical protein IT518_24320, partial [Burkholderiales bacterium]|nr:hypothetical protein [Burkholderiales bacterium]